MESYLVEGVGLAAGILTTLSFLPQVVKTYRTRETKNLSLVMYLVLFTGISTWFVYGLLIGSFSIIAANGATWVLVLLVLIMKIRFG